MFTKFDVPGLPDGTVTVPQPATCPELADVYNAPLCAFDHELVYIPMQVFLPPTGGEVSGWLIGLGVVLIVAAAAVFLSMLLTGAKKLDPARAEDDRA